MCSEAADIVFILDDSGSIADDSDTLVDNWELMLRFVADVVERHMIGSDDTRVGLLVFADHATNMFFLESYNTVDETVRAILATPYEGRSSNTAEGIRTAIIDQFVSSRGDRPDVPNIAVIVTDGLSNDPLETHEASLEAKSAGITIFSLGVGSSVDHNEIR